MNPGIIHRFRARLPLPENAPALTLGEGATPLLPLVNTQLPDGISVFVKIEGANPTGSFKDRGMVVAVAAAVGEGAECVICASTGNTSASAAAYAARAGIPCVVLLPAGKVAAGKIAQAVMHGARIIQVSGNFDSAMAAVKQYAGKTAALVNSVNPMRLQGQKTAALEIVEAFNGAPDYHALPVGNAGNITAYWLGYCEAAGRGTKACGFCGGACEYVAAPPLSNSVPKMLGYQAENAAPFVRGAPVENPETVATAIRIGNPQSFAAAQIAAEESGGRFAAVSDMQILETQKHLAAKEGVFCEPASAASVAGVLADIAAQKITAPARIVCTLTGHGLKDPDIAGKPVVQKTGGDLSEMQKALAEAINANAN